MAPPGWAQRLARLVGIPTRGPGRGWPSRQRGRRRVEGAAPAATPAPYPGDFSGTPDLSYAPHPDGRPDPGEVVWAWVPFEEDHSQGKDRPVLIVGRDGGWLLGLPLTSKDHDRDAAQERAGGREWVDIGSGAWDGRGRPSEVRVNRVVRIDPDTVRRQGAVLAQERFAEVAAAVRRLG